MPKAGALPHLLEIFDTSVNDVSIALRCEGYATPKPCVFSEGHNLFKTMAPCIVSICERNFCRRHIPGMNLFDISFHHRSGEWVAIDDLSDWPRPISAEWGRR